MAPVKPNFAVSDEPDPEDPPWGPGEMGIRTVRGDAWLVIETSRANPTGTEYVRLVGDDGEEIAYWDANEWSEAPVEVMGAIFGALVSGRRQ